jgi:flagellin-like protein
MKKLRKIRKNTKALSPVVASIILIAVTVAVSIAVAAWMGALSIGFMDTEQLSITNAAFADGTTITMTVSNTGTNDVVINSATVNDVNAGITGTTVTVPANSAGTQVELSASYTAGNSYQIVLASAKGNFFPYNVVAP